MGIACDSLFLPSCTTMLRLRRPLPLCGPRCGSTGPCMDAHILFHRRLMMGQNQYGSECGHCSSDQEAAFGTNGGNRHRADNPADKAARNLGTVDDAVILSIRGLTIVICREGGEEWELHAGAEACNTGGDDIQREVVPERAEVVTNLSDRHGDEDEHHCLAAAEVFGHPAGDWAADAIQQCEERARAGRSEAGPPQTLCYWHRQGDAE